MQQQHRHSPTRRKIDLQAIEQLAEPLVSAQGLQLVDIQWLSGSSGMVLRVTIDVPISVAAPGAGSAAVPAGVTVADCVRVSRDLSTALDVAELIEQAYSLEVSSPGLDRPLRSAEDFERQRGKLAKVKLLEPTADGQRVLRGVILEVSGGHLRMEVDGNTHDVPLSAVGEAKLVFELGRGSKKQPQRKRKRRRKRNDIDTLTGAQDKHSAELSK